MSFEKLIRIPNDRIGALIGRSGKTKKKIILLKDVWWVWILTVINPLTDQ